MSNQPNPNLPQKMGKGTSSMMVTLGSRLQSPSIRRVDVADKTLGRGIILSEQTLAVLLYYHDPGKDKDGKGYYLVSEEDVMNYGITAMLYYVILLGRLNTDARGVIIDDSVRVEYLRLKESSYNDLMDNIEEIGTRSLAMKKVVQGEFSHVECKPSIKVKDDVNHIAALEKISKMNIEALYKLVLREVGRDFSKFKDKLGFKLGEGGGEDDFETAGGGGAPKKEKAAASSTAFEESVPFEEVKTNGKEHIPGSEAKPAANATAEVEKKKSDTPDLGDDFPDLKFE